MVLSFILIIAFVVGAAALSNAFYAVESNENFSPFAEDFRIMHYVLNHLPYYVLLEAALIIVALYSKTSGGL